jgi:hypothetical protein
MLSLQEIQQSFKNAMLNRQDDGLARFIVENRIPKSVCLRIHRNNVFSSLLKAMRQVYPCIERLVGEECFVGLVQQYIHQFPSTMPDLRVYGEHFSEYLAAFPAIESLPYLPAVASLEWLCHIVFFEPELPALALAKLAAIDDAQYENIIFRLQPCCRVMSFDYPVAEIWDLCSAENERLENFPLINGKQQLLVARRQHSIHIEKITREEFIFLYWLSQQIKFSEVVKRSLQEVPQLALNILLAKYLQNCTIADLQGA